MQRTIAAKTPSGPVAPAGLRRVVLRARGLFKGFGGLQILRDVDLELREGEVVLLRGDNGSGKTTLLNILTGNLPPDAGMIEYAMNGCRAGFTFPRPWWQSLQPFDAFAPERVAQFGASRTWQETRLFESQNLRDNIAVASPKQPGESPLSVLLRPGSVARHERTNLAGADQQLARLGLAGREQSSADRISLGQSKRVAIARAVHGGAGVVFLDEPLAGLDEEGVRRVLDLLATLARAHAVTLVIVEHVLNIPRVLPIVETLWTLDDGQLKTEPKAAHGGDPATDTAIALLDGEVTRLFGGRPTTSVALPGGASLTRATMTGEKPGAPVLEVEGLEVNRGPRRVLGGASPADSLSFILREGELAVLRAPNGWGKTTLLEALAGILPAGTGSIRVRGKEQSSLPAWRRRLEGLALMQARQGSFDNLEVGEALRLASASAEAARVGVPLDRTVGSLSGGEKQRLTLLCSHAATSVAVSLWDEPFAMLDPDGLELAFALITPGLRQASLVVLPGLGQPQDPISRAHDSEGLPLSDPQGDRDVVN